MVTAKILSIVLVVEELRAFLLCCVERRVCSRIIIHSCSSGTALHAHWSVIAVGIGNHVYGEFLFSNVIEYFLNYKRRSRLESFIDKYFTIFVYILREEYLLEFVVDKGARCVSKE